MEFDDSTTFRPYVTPKRDSCLSGFHSKILTGTTYALAFITLVLSAYAVHETKKLNERIDAEHANPFLTLNEIEANMGGVSLYRGAGSWHEQKGLEATPANKGVSDWQAVAGEDGQIFLLGGFDDTVATLKSVYAYDVHRQTYTAKANMSETRGQFGAGWFTDASTGKVTTVIVAAGTSDSNNTNALQTSEKYNIASDTWTSGPTLKHVHLDGCMASTGDAVYMIGGWTAYYDAGSQKVEKLTRTGTEWSEVADLPLELGDCAAASLNGKVYVVGGYNNPGWATTCTDAGNGCFQNKLYEYDPTTNAWTEKAPMKQHRGDLQLVARGGKLLAIGGEIWHAKRDASGHSVDKLASHYVEEYFPELNRWEARQPLGTARFRFAAATSEWGTHVFGGSSVCATPTGTYDECHGYQHKSHEVYFELSHPNVYVNFDSSHTY